MFDQIYSKGDFFFCDQVSYCLHILCLCEWSRYSGVLVFFLGISLLTCLTTVAAFISNILSSDVKIK